MIFPRFHIFLLAAVLAVGLWSVIAPHDLFTWFLETFPAFIGLAAIAVTYRRFHLTNLAYFLIAVHCAILFVGPRSLKNSGARPDTPLLATNLLVAM